MRPGCPCCGPCHIADDNYQSSALEDRWTLYAGDWADVTWTSPGFVRLDATTDVELHNQTEHPDYPYASLVRARVRGEAGAELRLIVSASGDDALIAELVPDATCGTVSLYQRDSGAETLLAGPAHVPGAVADEWHTMRLCYDPETGLLTVQVTPHGEGETTTLSADVTSHLPGPAAGIASGVSSVADADFDDFAHDKLWYDVVTSPQCTAISVVTTQDGYSGKRFSWCGNFPADYYNAVVAFDVYVDSAFETTLSYNTAAAYGYWSQYTADEMAEEFESILNGMGYDVTVASTWDGESTRCTAPCNDYLSLTLNGPDAARIDLYLNATTPPQQSPDCPVVIDAGESTEGENETQVITVTSEGQGLFRLRYNGYETDDIATDATAAEIQAALESLDSLPPGNLSVTGPAGGPWVVEFVWMLAHWDVAQIEAVTQLYGCDSSYPQTRRETCSECLPPSCTFARGHFDAADSLDCDWEIDDPPSWSIDENDNWIETSGSGLSLLHVGQHPGPSDQHYGMRITAEAWGEVGTVLRFLIGYRPAAGGVDLAAIVAQVTLGADCGQLDFFELAGATETRIGNHHWLYDLVGDAWHDYTICYDPAAEQITCSVTTASGRDYGATADVVTITDGRQAGIGTGAGSTGTVRVRAWAAQILDADKPGCPTCSPSCWIAGDQAWSYDAGPLPCDWLGTGTWVIEDYVLGPFDTGVATGSGQILLAAEVHETDYVAAATFVDTDKDVDYTLLWDWQSAAAPNHELTIRFAEEIPDPHPLPNWSATVSSDGSPIGTYAWHGDHAPRSVTLSVCRHAAYAVQAWTWYVDYVTPGSLPTEQGNDDLVAARPAGHVHAGAEISGGTGHVEALAVYRSVLADATCLACRTCDYCDEDHRPSESILVDLGTIGLTAAPAPSGCAYCLQIGGQYRLQIAAPPSLCYWAYADPDVCIPDPCYQHIASTIGFSVIAQLQSLGGHQVKWIVDIRLAPDWMDPNAYCEGDPTAPLPTSWAQYRTAAFDASECDQPKTLTYYDGALASCTGSWPSTITLTP